MENSEDPGAGLCASYLGLDDTAITDTSVTYFDQIQASTVVGRLRRLLPLVNCRSRDFDMLFPLLLHIEAMVCRGELADRDGPVESGWLHGIRAVLAAHALDSASARRHVDTMASCVLRERRAASGYTELDEDGIRLHTQRRRSDVRLLVQLLCDAVSHAPADTVLRLLDPLLALREISGDIRTRQVDAKSGKFNIHNEYVRLFGRREGLARLRREQDRLARLLLRRWDELPRRKAAAVWPIVFDSSPAWCYRVLRALPKFITLSLAQRRLLAIVFSDAPVNGHSPVEPHPCVADLRQAVPSQREPGTG